MRIVYPVMWSRLGREACREQTVNTVAALARRGHDLTLLVPRGRDDPALGADQVKAYFDVEGDFRLVQRATRWAGESVLPSALWLRRVFRDPETASADLLLSRMPVLLAFGGASPARFALDHYRPWPDHIPAIRPLIRRTARSPQCLGLILHSNYAAQSYRRIGVDPQKLLVAHNGAEPRRMGEPLEKADARALTGLPPNRPIALYAGRINLAKGLDQVLALARLRPETLFVLVGSQGAGPIEKEAAALANVRILPWQEPSALPTYLHAADMLLIPASRAPLERHRNCVLPLKLFLYLAAGRPILAPASPDTAELLTHEETALLVPPGAPALAAAALDRLLGEPGLADRIGAEARRLSGRLSWDSRAERIDHFLRRRLEAASDLRQPGASPLRI